MVLEGTFNSASTHNYASEVLPTSGFEAFSGDPSMRTLTEYEINTDLYDRCELPADNQEEDCNSINSYKS